jgi:hypothetical protein
METNDKIIMFLSSLTKDELDSIPTLISQMRKEEKALEVATKLQAGTDMYDQFNVLNKRMYTINECADYIGIGRNRLAKYIAGLNGSEIQ